jgi:hypothetical protein
VPLPNRVATIISINTEEDSPMRKLVDEIMGFSIFAARLGLPCVALISYEDMINHGRLISEAVSIPMSGDADNDYKNCMHVKMRVKGFINAGFAGIIAISVKDEDGLEGAFTNRKAIEAHQFTMHVNFDGFSPGILVSDELVVTNMGVDCHIITSYHRWPFGQTGSGHFSPIGGYHAEQNMVFILDVACFKYPPNWVPSQLLWEAMNMTDDSTRLLRGFMLISRKVAALHCCTQ